MAALLDQIEWSTPILPRVDDPAWVATIERRGAPLGDGLRDGRFRRTPMRPAEVEGKAEPIRSFRVEGFAA